MTIRSKASATVERVAITAQGMVTRIGHALDPLKKKGAQFRNRVRLFWFFRGSALLERARLSLTNYWFVVAILGLDVALWWWNAGISKPKGLWSTPETLISMFAAIASILATIVGLSIAAVLVALQVLRATYSSSVVREVLRGASFWRTVSLYLVAIVTAIIGLISVGNPPYPRTIALAYVALAIFLVCLLALPGAITSLLNLTRIDQRRIEALALSINTKLVGPRVASRHPTGRGLQLYDEHPLFILGDVAVRALREHDRVLPGLVVQAVGERLLSFIDKAEGPIEGETGQEWRAVINNFLTVLRPVALTAASLGDDGTLTAVIHAIGAINDEAAKRRLPWFSVIELNETLEAITMKSLESGSNRAAQTAIHVIGHTLILNLTHNVAREEELLQFNDELSSHGAADRENQWATVVNTYIPMIARIVRAAAAHNSPDVVSTGIYRLGRLPDEVRDLPNLGARQKERVIGQGVWYAADALVAAVDKLGEAPPLGITAFDAWHTIDDLAEGKPWAQQAILQLCSVTRAIAERGRLAPFDLNTLGAAGRGAVNKVVGDDRSAEAVVLLAETIAYVASEAAERKRPGYPRIIDEAANQLQSFERWNKGNLATAPRAFARVGSASERVRALVKQLGDNRDVVVWPTLAPVANIDIGPKSPS